MPSQIADSALWQVEEETEIAENSLGFYFLANDAASVTATVVDPSGRRRRKQRAERFNHPADDGIQKETN